MLLRHLSVFALLTFHLASAFWPFTERSDDEDGKIFVFTTYTFIFAFLIHVILPIKIHSTHQMRIAVVVTE